MPQNYNPESDEMDESHGAAGAPVEAPEKPAESVDEENAGASEILISKDKLPTGTKEGDTCTFKVVKDFGDEFSLEYVSEESAGTPSEPEEPMSTAARELTALDQEGA